MLEIFGTILKIKRCTLSDIDMIWHQRYSIKTFTSSIRKTRKNYRDVGIIKIAYSFTHESDIFLKAST